MSQKMPMLKDLRQTCEACPSQWEGHTADGRFIYIRYRWGHLTVDLDDYRGGCIFEWSSDDLWDGYMDTEAMLEITGLEYGS